MDYLLDIYPDAVEGEIQAIELMILSGELPKPVRTWLLEEAHTSGVEDLLVEEAELTLRGETV